MRHDYDLPPEWSSMSPEEKNRWFYRNRSYRQAKAQDTAFSRHLKKAEERLERRINSRSETTDVIK